MEEEQLTPMVESEQTVESPPIDLEELEPVGISHRMLLYNKDLHPIKDQGNKFHQVLQTETPDNHQVSEPTRTIEVVPIITDQVLILMSVVLTEIVNSLQNQCPINQRFRQSLLEEFMIDSMVEMPIKITAAQQTTNQLAVLLTTT